MQRIKYEHILDVARNLFLSLGLDRTSMDEVCRAAHVSKRTIYLEFRSKNELVAAVYAREMLRLFDLLQKEDCNTSTPNSRLEQLVRGSLIYYHSDKFFRSMVAQQHSFHPPIHCPTYRCEIEPRVISYIEEILIQGIDAGEFRELDTRTAAYAIFKIVQSFTLAHYNCTEVDIEHNAAELSRLIRASISNISSHVAAVPEAGISGQDFALRLKDEQSLTH